MVDNKEVVGDSAPEVIEDKRSFKLDGDEASYFIKQPTGEDIRQADWHYARMFNKALGEGFLTSGEIMRQLEERGIVGGEHDKELTDLQTKITENVIVLDSLPAEEMAERQKVAIEVSKLRANLYDLNHRVNGPLSNSCENLSEDARLSYLTSKVIVDEEENFVWETFEDLQSDNRTSLLSKSKFEVMLWLQGLPSDFLSNLPEQKVIEEVKEKLLTDIVKNIEIEVEAEAKKDEEDNKEVVDSTPSDVGVPEDKVMPKKRGRKPKAKITKKTKKEPDASKNVEADGSESKNK